MKPMRSAMGGDAVALDGEVEDGFAGGLEDVLDGEGGGGEPGLDFGIEGGVIEGVAIPGLGHEFAAGAADGADDVLIRVHVDALWLWGFRGFSGEWRTPAPRGATMSRYLLDARVRHYCAKSAEIWGRGSAAVLPPAW
jgi:hypothetical protein